ncbi:MAG: Mur ligase family protein [Bdellovibrionota bacterium]
MCETYIQERLAQFGGERRPHYDLGNLKKALASLDHPEKQTRCVLVGGTNGKGSTSLLLSAALTAHGYRVRTYTSPHLYSPTERFLHNLDPIPAETLLALIEQHAELAKAHSLSYFEYLTLLFFEWCRQQTTDYAIVEVGLGGALDATNVFDPLASVLTNVDLDHQEYLGPTREIILQDKIQISREGRTLYTGVSGSLLQAAEAYASKHGVFIKTPPSFQLRSRGWDGQRLGLENTEVRLADPSEATAHNAALAWEVLRSQFPEISIPTLQHAFSSVRFPGRFEVLADSPRTLLCGAHNPHGLESLRSTLESLPKTGPLHVVCAFSGDKPYREMFDLLNSIADKICVTENSGARNPGPSTWPEGTPMEADLEAALNRYRPDSPEGTLLITGSLYLIGAARKLLGLPLCFAKDLVPIAQPTVESPFCSTSGDASPAKLQASAPAQNPARA